MSSLPWKLFWQEQSFLVLYVEAINLTWSGISAAARQAPQLWKEILYTNGLDLYIIYTYIYVYEISSNRLMPDLSSFPVVMVTYSNRCLRVPEHSAEILSAVQNVTDLEETFSVLTEDQRICCEAEGFSAADEEGTWSSGHFFPFPGGDPTAGRETRALEPWVNTNRCRESARCDSTALCLP